MKIFVGDISLKDAKAAKEKLPNPSKIGLTWFGRQITNQIQKDCQALPLNTVSVLNKRIL